MSISRMLNDYHDPDKSGLFPDGDESEPFDLSIFNRGDGAHCGLSDWYDDKEKALEEALASGQPFDTGWYCSKKEIQSTDIEKVS